MKKFMKNEKGFTLVELLVVVIIIGILTAIAIPVYNSASKKAEQRAVEANLKTIDSAVQQHKMDQGSYPSKIDDLKTNELLLEVPKGPGDATYSLSSDNPPRAIVTSTEKVGGLVLGGKKLEEITWP